MKFFLFLTNKINKISKFGLKLQFIESYGLINNIFAMNIMGDGRSSLIHIEEEIADCHFMNGIYSGDGEYIVSYNYIDNKDTYRKYIVSENNTGRNFVKNVKEINMVKTRQ